MYELLERAPHGSSPSRSPSFDRDSEANSKGRPSLAASRLPLSANISETGNLFHGDSLQTPTLPARPIKANIFKHRWLWEISAAVFSVLCTVAVILILATANGKTLSSWTFFIFPNALISIFSTLAKAALMVPVAASISQLKWIYFEQAHPLNELDVFDEASRGPWGSLELIQRLKMRPQALMATWGGIITIIALAMDPFAQQILSFPSRQTLLHSFNGTAAYLGVTQLYDTKIALISTADEVFAKNYTVPYIPKADSTMTNAVLNGLINDSFAPDFVCPTAECHWPQQQTLAICNQCTDVVNTSSISCTSNNDPSSCTATTPKGVVLQLDPQFNATAVFPGDGSLRGNPPALVNIDIFRDNGHSRNLFECELSLCVKVFHDTRAVGGKISTQSTEEFALSPSGPENYPGNVTGPRLEAQHYYAYDVFTVPNSATSFKGNRTFTINTEDRRAIGSYLADLFTMNQTKQEAGLLKLLFNSPDIAGQIHNVSLSMTNAMRKSGNATGRSGEVYAHETYIHVRWEWFVLPLLVVVMAVVFLVASIVQSARHRAPAWKNSVLPFLFSSLDGWQPEDLSVSGPRELDRKAKTMSGSVMGGDRGGELRFVKR